MRRMDAWLSFMLVLSLVGCGSASVEIASPRAETLPIAAAGSGLPGQDDADEAIRETVDLSRDAWIELDASPGAAALVPGGKAVGLKQWREARMSLEAALAGMQDAPVDQRFAGLALLGRACDFLKDREAAERAYSSILDGWKGETTVRAAIAAAGDDPTARRESVQRVLLAVGEALYFITEEKRDSADDARPPGYTGTPRFESAPLSTRSITRLASASAGSQRR